MTDYIIIRRGGEGYVATVRTAGDVLVTELSAASLPFVRRWADKIADRYAEILVIDQI